MKYDAFLSYATEDSDEADAIVEYCGKFGFNIWYAPISLEPGEKLLQSIDNGLKQSSHGILLLSKSYLQKKWPKYEFDVLMRQNIEEGKTIIPIWYKIDKRNVEELSPGLAGIVGILASKIEESIIEKIKKVLSQNAPTIGIIPIYQNPRYLFLSGKGEIVIGSPDGPATTLWELIIYLDPSKYPLFLDGQLFSREDLLNRAAGLIMHIPETVENYVRKEGRMQIIKILKDEGYYISE